MLRSFWKGLGVSTIAAFAFAGLSTSAFAQDKPAEKPKSEEKKPEAKPKAEEHKKEEKKAEAKPDVKAELGIVETAMLDKDCATLCELLKAADLVETLKGPGPFTVFAPTNAAFEKAGGKEALMKDKAKLAGVLKYHVHAGSMMAADVTKAKTIKTVNGAELTVSGKDKEWMVDKAKITKTDVKCKNGVIHIIDAVCMPAEKKEEKKTEKNPG